MAAAKKTAAKKAASSDAVSTVSEETGISPELESARDDVRKAEVESGLKDASGALLVTDNTPEIDPELVKARDAALKAEQNRKTY